MGPEDIKVRRVDAEYNKEINVQLEKLDGSLLDWDTYSELEPISRQAQLSRFLHITTLTTPVQIRAAGLGDRYISLKRDEMGVWEFVVDYYDPWKLPSEGLALHLVGSTRDHKCPQSLVVGMIDGVYERLGMVNEPDDGTYFNTAEMEKSYRTIRLG
jgi:hypothetical protein